MATTYIREAASSATPVGEVCRYLTAHIDRLRLLCLKKLTGELTGYNLTDCELTVVMAANAHLARHRKTVRVLSIVANSQQHHVVVAWAKHTEGRWVSQDAIVNLYPPSRRKPGEEGEEVDAPLEEAVL